MGSEPPVSGPLRKKTHFSREMIHFFNFSCARRQRSRCVGNLGGSEAKPAARIGSLGRDLGSRGPRQD